MYPRESFVVAIVEGDIHGVKRSDRQWASNSKPAGNEAFIVASLATVETRPNAQWHVLRTLASWVRQEARIASKVWNKLGTDYVSQRTHGGLVKII